MSWLVANWALIVSVLLGLSEVLALIPGIQSNSVFQLIANVIKSLGTKALPPSV